MSIWYAVETDGNWGDGNEWNSAADGSGGAGTPANYDTCDLNGNTVHVNADAGSGASITIVNGSGGSGLLLLNTAYQSTCVWGLYCNIQVSAHAAACPTRVFRLTVASGCGTYRRSWGSLAISSGGCLSLAGSGWSAYLYCGGSGLFRSRSVRRRPCILASSGSPVECVLTMGNVPELIIEGSLTSSVDIAGSWAGITYHLRRRRLPVAHRQ